MAVFISRSKLALRVTRQTLAMRNFATSSYNCSNKVPEEAFPKNLLANVHSSSGQPLTGKIFDKKPFRMRLEKGKKYAWCCCGRSGSQPLCDGTHKLTQMKIKERPVFFIVEETKDYWLCNCKRTKHNPFCDGTHLNPEIQELKFPY